MLTMRSLIQAACFVIAFLMYCSVAQCADTSPSRKEHTEKIVPTFRTLSLPSGVDLLIECPSCSDRAADLLASDLKTLLSTTEFANGIELEKFDEDRPNFSYNYRWPKPLRGQQIKWYENGTYSIKDFPTIGKIHKQDNKLRLSMDDKHVELYEETARWLEKHADIETKLHEFIKQLNTDSSVAQDPDNYFPSTKEEGQETRQLRALNYSGRNWETFPLFVDFYLGTNTANFFPNAVTIVNVWHAKSSIPASLIYVDNTWKIFVYGP